MTTGIEPRLPLVERDGLSSRDRQLYDEIAQTRYGMPTSFRVFLNSPGAARAISEFGSYVRFKTPLVGKTLEIAVMRVAALTDDDYMWAHHLQIARDAGLTDEDLGRLRDPAGRALADPADANLSRFVDAQVQGSMSDAVFTAVVAQIGPARAVEFALAVAYYMFIHSLFGALRLEGTEDTRIPAATGKPEAATTKENQ